MQRLFTHREGTWQGNEKCPQHRWTLKKKEVIHERSHILCLYSCEMSGIGKSDEHFLK